MRSKSKKKAYRDDVPMQSRKNFPMRQELKKMLIKSLKTGYLKLSNALFCVYISCVLKMLTPNFFYLEFALNGFRKQPQ